MMKKINTLFFICIKLKMIQSKLELSTRHLFDLFNKIMYYIIYSK